jgi:outer membrane lipoprotein-sorting protein
MVAFGFGKTSYGQHELPSRRYSVRVYIIAVLMALLAAPCFSAQTINAPELLRKAYAAEKTTAYSAVVEVRTAGGTTATMKVWSSRGRKRIEYLSEPARGQILIDDGRALYRLNEAEKAAVWMPTPEGSERLDLIFRNYKVTVEGTEDVAGRKAFLLRIAPKQPPGPSKRLWIDRETKLILRSESFASDGTLKTASRMTSLTLNPKLSEGLFSIPEGWRIQKPPADEQTRWTASELSKRLGIKISEPGYLPPGFVLEGMYLVRMGMMRWEAAHIRYVDGLNSLSVFQRPLRQGPGQGRGRWGGWRWRGGRGPDTEQEAWAVGGVGRLIRVVRPGKMYIVVADLPEKELRKVADSLP